MSEEVALEARLLAAHAGGDMAALPGLYLRAAVLREAQGDIDAACFFFTHAYVYALDAGDEECAQAARGSLVDYGRDR